MKYRMNKNFFHRNLLLFLPFLLVFFGFCNSPEVQDQLETIPPGPEVAQASELLRLSYDSAFRVPTGGIVEERSNLHEKGNRYKIRMASGNLPFNRITVSSTNSENRSRFPYEVSEKEIEKAKWKKYYYMPVRGHRHSATISLFSCGGGGLACLRWEWNYNGFLLVIESEGSLPRGELNQEDLAETYHSLVEKHLLIY
jgi:hypothetical protein